MIKFPTTLNEYTDGKLWKGERKESVAKRVLYGLSDVDDPEELKQRKLYLAYFYYDKGAYFLSAKILRELLLDGEYVQDILRILERDYVQLKDSRGMSDTFSLLTKFDKEEEKRFIRFLQENNRDEDALQEGEEADDFVEYSNGQVSYHRNGQLLYSLEDNDYRTFVANLKANGALNSGHAKQTVEILDKVKKRHIKRHTLLSMSVTYARAYLELGDLDKAFGYCKECMAQNLYIEAMLDIMLGARAKGKSEIYESIKEFISKKDDLSTDDLVGLSVLSREGEEELWQIVCKNNPFDNDDISEERYLLEGINYYNDGRTDKAEECWYKADALYGIFSRAKSYLCFADKFGGREKSGVRLTLERSSNMDDMLEILFLEKLKNCKSKSDIKENIREITIALEGILANTLPSLEDTAQVLYNIYKIDYAPLTAMLKGAIVNDDYFYIVRIIALGCFAALSGKKTFIFEGKVYKNPMTAFDKSGGRENLVFALSMYFAQCILRDGKGKSTFIKKIYALLSRDYSGAPVLAIFWLMLKFEGMSNSPEFFSFCPDRKRTLDFLFLFKEDMLDNISAGKDVAFCRKAFAYAQEMEDYMTTHAPELVYAMNQKQDA